MEVILLERVGRLGHMGDVVRVKDGFARNFLLPKGKALRATKENKAKYEGMKETLETRNVELRAGFPTLGTMLREQGYYTAYKGKWHLSVINQKIGTDKFPNATRALEPYGFSDYNFDGEHTGLTWAGFGHDGVTAAESILSSS